MKDTLNTKNTHYHRNKGRNKKLNPITHRYVFRLNDEENAQFLSLFEQSGMKIKAHFITSVLFNREIRSVVKKVIHNKIFLSIKIDIFEYFLVSSYHKNKPKITFMKGVLKVKNIQRTLTEFRLSHHKNTDTSGYPSSLPKASFFEVSFLAEEGDDFFLHWMCGKNMAHGGAKGFWHSSQIIFYDERSDGQEIYRYDLEYVMPIKFRLEYDHQSGMVIHLTLTALDRVYNHLLHTENFYGYFFEYAKPKEKPKPMINDEPKITEIYYTDEKGNRIDKGVIGQDIYLIIKGESLKGEETDLDLSDDEIDFEYQGERLVDDILKGYIFENDKQEEIPLKVVTPKN